MTNEQIRTAIMKTDTPRTNKEAFAHFEGFCVSIAFARKLERELNESNRLKNLALSRMDDALEKAESLSTPDCHICRNKCQRPLCILSKELAASKAEVERLKELVNQSIVEKSNLSIALVNCQADLSRAIDVARMLPVIPIPAISSRDITDTLYAELNQLKATLKPTNK